MNNSLTIPKLLKEEPLEDCNRFVYLVDQNKWRPSELIHYFDQDGEYLESVLKTETFDKMMTVEVSYPTKYGMPDSPKYKRQFFWISNGKNKNRETFNLNTRSIPQSPVHQQFWGAVKDGFAKRKSRVEVSFGEVDYSFIVQYLVKQD